MVAPQFHAQSLTELIALRAEFGDELLTLTYSDISRAVDRLAAHYAACLDVQLPASSDEAPPERVIAVLVSTAVDESLLEIALARLGLAALLLSVNNSVPAVAHLCKITKSSHLIYGPKFADAAIEAQGLLEEEGVSLGIIPDKRFPLWGPGGVRDPKTTIAPFPARLTPLQEAKRTCVILHSSGSTGFPKPVYVTHFGMVANAAQSVPKTGFSALPLFHGFGHFSIFRCIYHGKAFTLLPPHLPITAANIVSCIKRSPTPPVQHFAVPYVLKLLGESEEGTASLASMEAVSFAGAAVPDDLGDRLVAAGVPLISVYGTTETGAIMNSRRDYSVDKLWNYVRAEGLIANYLELVPQGANSVEVVVLDGWPAKIMSNRDDGAYATKDLFQRHPEHPTLLKYIGRLDDTLTQTLGEKTNPVPIELAIRGNSPLIAECIVFGDGRPQVGALILPSDTGAELSRDRTAYLDAIWPVIADANSRAPTHSRILPEMVEVLPYGTEVPVATKMSILRPACYRKFASMIDAIYTRFEEGGVGAASLKLDIQDCLEMRSFITKTITDVLGPKRSAGLEDDTDLFAFGVDSLQATRVRNVLQKRLELGGATLGQNVVYEHPSVSQLAAYLLSIRAGAGDNTNGAALREKTNASMLAMVDRWASMLVTPAPVTAPSSSEGEVIILTGATGSLGAHIVDQLTRRPEVARVVCFARASSDDEAAKRVSDSLADRKRSLSPSQTAKIEALAADVNRQDLGLSPRVYDRLRDTSTSVVHNAWPVNFALSLDSFEPHVGGAVNLLNLALSSPRPTKPTFYFSSSVGTRQGIPGGCVAEDFPSGPETASGMGYAQSKWVVEKLIERAGSTGARAGVLRIGQLVGDTEHGVWNETEAWPLLFRAADVLHALPSLQERAQWLPVDLAAASIAEIILADSPEGGVVYHVLNSHEAAWPDILDGLRAGGLDFDTVSRQDWIRRLAESETDVAKNPTRKLLPFYERRLGADEERAPIVFEVAQTSKVSPTIAGLKPVGPTLAAKWVGAWKQSGFME